MTTPAVGFALCAWLRAALASSLCLLLLATLCAVTEAKRQHMMSPETRILFDVVEQCIQPGSARLLGSVKKQRCPCFVSYGLTARQKSQAAVDFLVMTAEAYDEWEGREFQGDPEMQEQFSVFGKRANLYSFLHDEHYFQTPNMELKTEGEYAFVVRTTAKVKECETAVRYIFERMPDPCPERLPGDRAEGEQAIGESRAEDALLWETSGGPENNVVAGTAVTDDAIQSYMVAIKSSTGACSGTVIAPKWILTAAHCRVGVGSTARVGGATNRDGTPYRVVEFVTHPDYRQSKSGDIEVNDIAVMRVDREMTGARAVVLNTDAGGPSPGEFVRASGYGQIAEDWTTPAAERGLRQVDMPTVGFEACLRAFVEFGAGGFARGLNGRAHMCAGYLKEECRGDTCYGDSGGPIVMRTEGLAELVQVGVVSGGIGCARKGLPGVYTRVARYYKWVEEVARGVKGAGVGGNDASVGIEVGGAVDEAEEEKVNKGANGVSTIGLVVAGVAGAVGVVLLVGGLLVLAVKRRRKGVGRSKGGGGGGGSEETVGGGDVDESWQATVGGGREEVAEEVEGSEARGEEGAEQVIGEGAQAEARGEWDGSGREEVGSERGIEVEEEEMDDGGEVEEEEEEEQQQQQREKWKGSLFQGPSYERHT